MQNKDMSAMPLPITTNDGVIHDTSDYSTFNIGLTKREHFAGLAMQGLLAGENATAATYHWNKVDFGAQAVEMADALLAALEKS